MTNLFDYLLWRGDIPFEAMGFNEIDGMIMARFAYAPFDGIVSDSVREKIRVDEVCQKILEIPNLEEKVLHKEDIRLFQELAVSERFKRVQLCNFESILDDQMESQFCAITAKLYDGLYCIAFRGTDDTLVGWKEDFNMAFTYPVGSQKLALSYLEDTGMRIRGNIVLTGHSKGGNIAVYAGAFCTNGLKRRIVQIYNYDGPGFDERCLETKEYQEICNKVLTFVPQGSVIGMILGHMEEHIVIHSEALNGFFQHNMYTWEVIGKYFVGVEEGVTKGSQIMDKTLKDWVYRMDLDTREKYVEILYSVVAETNATTLKELTENWMENARLISKSLKNMDGESKKVISHGMKLFRQSLKASMSDLRYKEELEDEQ